MKCPDCINGLRQPLLFGAPYPCSACRGTGNVTEGAIPRMRGTGEAMEAPARCSTGLRGRLRDQEAERRRLIDTLLRDNERMYVHVEDMHAAILRLHEILGEG